MSFNYRPPFKSKENNVKITTRGWICPVCGRGNAPWMAQCTCKFDFKVGDEVSKEEKND